MYYLSTFKLVNAVSGPECHLSCCMFHVSLRNMHILPLLGKVVYKCQLYPVNWWCWAQLCPYWFFASWMCPFLIEKCWFPATIVNSSISLCSSISLLHVIWCSAVRSVHNKNCYISLEKWLIIFFFLVPFFLPDYFPYFEVCSV